MRRFVFATRRPRPARIEILSSRGTYHLVRLLAGALPEWLIEERDPSAPFQLGRRIYVLDVDEIGECERRGELEIDEKRRPRIRGAR